MALVPVRTGLVLGVQVSSRRDTFRIFGRQYWGRDIRFLLTILGGLLGVAVNAAALVFGWGEATTVSAALGAIVILLAVISWHLVTLTSMSEGIDSQSRLIREEVARARRALVADTDESIAARLDTAHDLTAQGVCAVTSRWRTLILHDNPRVGQRLRDKLYASRDATWQFLCILPQGFEPWLPIAVQAVKEGRVRIKWIMHTPSSLEAHPALLSLHRMLVMSDEGRSLTDAQLLTNAQAQYSRFKGIMREENMKDCLASRAWEFYESSVPHTYMGFLSVPESNELKVSPRIMQAAPPNTFGLIHLYPMYVKDMESKPALYLESGSSASTSQHETLDYFYWSTNWLLERGREDGVVRKVNPLGD